MEQELQPPAPPSELRFRYKRLDELLEWRWDMNPKNHQRGLILNSIRMHGFNDPPGVDYEHQIVTEGHGRLEELEALRAAWLAGQPAAFLPKNILLAEDRMWLIPTIEVTFDTKDQATLYALAHNRSNTAKLLPEDYDGVKLARAVGQARAAGQLEMIGFGDGDLMTGGAVGPGLALPPIPEWDAPEGGIFDPSKLADAPGYQSGQAAQSWVVMITFPRWEDMLEGVRALTAGARRGLPKDAKFCSVEGMSMLDTWRALLLGEGQAPPRPTRTAGLPPEPAAAPLPGQIGFDGSVVGADVAAPGGDQQAAFTQPVPEERLGYREAIPVAEVPSWDTPEAALSELQGGLDPALAEEPAAGAAPPAWHKEPKWVGGLCATCGGSGFTGVRGIGPERHKIMCSACDGAGDAEAWRARFVPQQAKMELAAPLSAEPKSTELPF